MDKKLPIYRMILNDKEDSGVNFVALVDSPANLSNFFAFNEHKEFKFVADSERKIVTGCLVMSELPIYRKDESGEYFVVFDAGQVELMAQKFMRLGYQNNVNEMHDPNKVVEGVYLFESFITDEQRGIKPPKGFEGIPNGSWFGSYKVDNEEVWAKVKAGEFKGFSVEGMFGMERKAIEQPKDLEKEIIDIISSIKTV